MQSSIDIPLANGWHVTIFGPAMWLLVVAAASLVVEVDGRASKRRGGADPALTIFRRVRVGGWPLEF